MHVQAASMASLLNYGHKDRKETSYQYRSQIAVRYVSSAAFEGSMSSDKGWISRIQFQSCFDVSPSVRRTLAVELYAFPRSYYPVFREEQVHRMRKELEL